MVTAWLHAIGMSSASQGRQGFWATELITINDTGLWLVTVWSMSTGTLLVEDSVGPHLLTMDEPGNKTPISTPLLLYALNVYAMQWLQRARATRYVSMLISLGSMSAESVALTTLGLGLPI